MVDELRKQQEMYQTHQMSEPKSPMGIFELPCGFLAPDGELITEVSVKEITGVEEEILNAKNLSGGKKMTQVLGNCIVQLGQMVDKPILLRVARELTIGDRSFLMLAIRRVTLGDQFPFEDQCKACNVKSLFEVDLGQLETKKMPDPKKRVFDEKLPGSGATARFHVMTGKDEESMSKVDARDALSAAILVRLDSINGQPVTMEIVKALSMRDRNHLRDRFDDVEGGVETGLTLCCPACGEEFETELNPGNTGFFFPSRIRKNSKRSTSSF